MRLWRRTGCLPILCCLLPVAAAQPDADPVEARFNAPAVVHATPGLQPGRERYTGNDELETALRALAARPGGPQLLQAGRSQRGVPLLALRFGTAILLGADGPEAPGRPTALLVGQQHGDEPAGAEALLVLATRLADGAAADLLRRIDIVVLPRANPDGAARGLRNAADDTDINRDHLLLRTPEARAVAALAERFAPLLVVDLHEYRVSATYRHKFGAVQRADLLLQPATTVNLAPAVSAIAEADFREPLLRALVQQGLGSDVYHVEAIDPLDLRLSMGSVQPDNLRNVQGLHHAVSFLLESRGGGLGKRHLQRRVHSHLTALWSLLGSAAEHAGALIAMRARAGAAVAAAACQGRTVVLAAPTQTRRNVTMLDPDTGADKVVGVGWLAAEALRPLVERPRPCAYWLDAAAAEAVQRLRWLGLRVDSVSNPQRWRVEAWDESLRLDSASGLRLVQAATRDTELNAAPGSYRVPLDQPLANLAIAALEPDTPYSYYAQRLLPRLASAARILNDASAPPRSTEQRPEHAADQLAPDRGADAAHR